MTVETGTLAAMPAGIGYRAIADREDRRTPGRTKIDAGVHAYIAKDRVAAQPEG